MKITIESHEKLLEWLMNNKNKDFITFRKCFTSFPEETLRSIFSAERQKQTKIAIPFYYKVENRIKCFQWYSELSQTKPKSGFVREYAEKVLNLAPGLLARIILEEYLRDQSIEISSEKDVTEMMRDTGKINDKQLAQEIWLCCLYDEVYGPISDTIKFVSGQEQENLLKSRLKKSKIPFLDENQLRDQGYDKTPDVKLEIPCVIDENTVINWIESKALFGDAKSHENYLQDQYRTYTNRFGPGLVIYWFGFIQELDIHETEGIYLSDSFPENIRSMMDILKK